MKELLFLSHRIPYPPDKGDKIRSYHLLKRLAERYRVHLGTFVDDPADRVYQSTLEALCEQTCFVRLDPRRARLKSARGVLTGEPLTFTYYRNRRLTHWVRRLLAERDIHAVVAFSSSMGPYVRGLRDIRRVLDFVDVDSDKWRQYAREARPPLSWIYRREFKRLLAAEIKLARDFDASVFVSESEADLFRRLAPRSRARVVSLPNGVDAAYFDPDRDYADPYDGGGEHALVFTGAMDYRANVDAAVWFADQVLPRIQARVPDAAFWIVGSRPTPEVRALVKRSGVQVTGRVPDVRPFMRHAGLVVAPLRIARGLQNKVLEALAMDRPVLATPQAWEGIEGLPDACGMTAADAETMAARAAECLMAPSACGGAARRFVRERFDWDRTVAGLSALIEAEPAGERASRRSAESAVSGACLEHD